MNCENNRKRPPGPGLSPWPLWLLALAVLGGTTCTDQVGVGLPESDTEVVLDDRGDLSWGTALLAASTLPTLIITDPPNHQYVTAGPVVTPVVISFSVLNFPFPSEDHRVRFYINNTQVGEAIGSSVMYLDDVPPGRQVIAAVLIRREGGVWVELSNQESRDFIYLRVSRACSGFSDPICDDGIPCSMHQCVHKGNLQFECRFGSVFGCCMSDYECSPGWRCIDTKCSQCETSADCDDQNHCTMDTCVNGLCINDHTPHCCRSDSDCNDGLFCTVDLCNLATNQCIYSHNGDPNCCESLGDPVCNDGDPCTVDKCISHVCRHGPVVNPLCCRTAADCNDGNPCTIDQCDPQGNSCVWVPDTTMVGCCTFHTDCDDGDPSTLDWCQQHFCAHTPNPVYCDGSGNHPCLPDDNPCTVDACVASVCTHQPTPGCCTKNADCKDNDPCTMDLCGMGGGGTGNCWFPPIEPCCKHNSHCDDDNPCTVDRCINHTCRHGPDAGFLDCCNTASDCDDGCDCTEDYCQEDNTCRYVSVGDGCCFSDLNCDDNNPYTVDRCKACQCEHSDSPMVCNEEFPGCEDGNPCTLDTCNLLSGMCMHTIRPDCCLQHTDCDDGNSCTLNACDLVTNTCLIQFVENCCQTDGQCSDADPCTVDRCVNRQCRHLAVQGCCTLNQHCATGNTCYLGTCNTLSKQCVYSVNTTPGTGCCSTPQDCYDGMPCTEDRCVNFKCAYTDITDCCTPENAVVMCDDKNPCTWDTCVFGRCRNIGPPQAPPSSGIPDTCCVKDNDCPPDDTPCTLERCIDGLCQYVPLVPCYLPLPYQQDFSTCGVPSDVGWTVVNAGTDVTANWVCSAAGPLGPDRHVRFDWQPWKTGVSTFLVSPWLSLAGQKRVTLQWDRYVDYYSGSLDFALAVSDQMSFLAGYTELWQATVTSDLAAETGTLVLPDEFLGKGVRLGIRVTTDNTYYLDAVDFDTVRVCPGNRPYFVTEPLTMGLLWNEPLTVELRAADLDPLDKLSFQLQGAPSFVSLGHPVHAGQVDYVTVKLIAQPTISSQMGEYRFVVLVSDGCLVNRLPVTLRVLQSGGWLIFSPPSVPPIHATRLSQAVTASGRQVQVVSDLGMVPSFGHLDGIIVTLGVYGASHALTSQEGHRLATFLGGGGRIYMEGGRTWSFDPKTLLHSMFPIAGLGTGPQILSTPITGVHFQHGFQFNLGSSYAVNSFLDRITPEAGGVVLGRVAGTNPFHAVVALQHSGMRYRVVGTSIPFAALLSGASNPTTWMGRILNFLENGWPPCASDAHCSDLNPCTTDSCGADWICRYQPVAGCVFCRDDGDCPSSHACVPGDSICQQVPGVQYQASAVPLSIDTHAGNATVSSVLTVAAMGTVSQVHAKVSIQHAYPGELRVLLRHGGHSVILRAPDATRGGTAIRQTFSFGVLPDGPGDLSAFAGTELAGDWVLEIEDLAPGSGSGVLAAWSIFVVTGPCNVDGDCFDGDPCTRDECYHFWCRHLPMDCADQHSGGANLCTTDWCDPVLGCVHQPKDCDDGNPCTADQCAPATGTCSHVAPNHCIAPCSTHADCGRLDYCDSLASQCKPVPGTTFSSAESFPRAIPDGSLTPLTSRITVPNTGILSRVLVKVVIQHTYRGDLSVWLDNGTYSVRLHNRQGGAADDLVRVWSFDAEAGPGSLSGYEGLQPNGEWTLRVEDHAPGDKGSLLYWNLFLTIHQCRTDLDCDDGTMCTLDRCVSSGETRVCAYTEVNCSDGLFCNGEETCHPTLGCVAGVPPKLSDGVSCTADYCDESSGKVVHSPSDAYCDDGLWCNGREYCDPLLGCRPGVPVAVDDGVVCTLDFCDETIRQVLHLPDSARCDDGLWCTGREVCDPALDCQPGVPPSRDDGVACTREVCREGLRVIQSVADDTLCDDGLYCNGIERCHPTKGCRAGTPPVLTDGVNCTLDHCDEGLEAVVHVPQHSLCDDGNPCTNDVCYPVSGCTYVSNESPCEDGNWCTLGDQCFGGACVPGGLRPECLCSVDEDCPDDGNVCNGSYRCVTGVCVVDPATVVDCGTDHTGCRIISCDPVTGSCSTAQRPDGTTCDGDGSLCTVNGRCQSGFCIEFPRNCSDGVWCNGTEACNPAVGCVPGVPPVLGDGVVCTADLCDEDTQSVLHIPVHSYCFDGLFCNGDERCDVVAGCVAGTPPVLDDGLACTLDLCNETLDVVEHIPRNQLCDDGVFCNGAERCDPASGCIPGSLEFLDDGVDCTVGTCDEVSRVISHVPSDALCSDGDLCNGVETCHSGVGCLPGTPVLVSDGILCTVDVCDPVTGVVSRLPDDSVCDDGLFCNGAEWCQVGLGCQPGVPPRVQDAFHCTDDLCDESTGSVLHVPIHTRCDDGIFCTDNECVPGQGCVVSFHTRPCDNGEPCTMNDRCQSGKCVAGNQNPECWCAVNFDCPQDLNVCNGFMVCQNYQCVVDPLSIVTCDPAGDTACSVNQCNPATGVCERVMRPTGALCDDGNACTVRSVCGDLGSCVATEWMSCNNGMFCDGVESCDPMLGCVPGVPPVLSDGVVCTEDLCDERNRVIRHVRRDDWCDDGLFCNGPERCNGVIGCVPGPVPLADDGIPCTLDFCDEVSRSIVNLPRHDLCSDADPCNGQEVCDPQLGCLPGVLPGLDDGVDCTLDVCDPVTGQIQHIPRHAHCDDALFCNGSEVCHAVLGCVPGTPPVVDDGIDCTLDACDEALDRIVHLRDDIWCDDGVFCNGAEKCDVRLGCISVPVTGLDDGVACTVDLCDEATGSIQHLPHHATCDDGLYCNGAERCDLQAGCQPGAPPAASDGIACTLDLCDEVTRSIQHVPQDPLCKDDNLCTTDRCIEGVGCVWLANTSPCDDGEACTVGDSCSNGVCVGGLPSGAPACGCVVDGDCPDDGNLCNGVLFCQGGRCVIQPDSPVICPPSGNPCVQGVCQPVTGACVFQPAPSGFPCDDGNPCTRDDSCGLTGICGGITDVCNDGMFCNGVESCNPATGACAPGTPLVLNDGTPCTVDYCDEYLDAVIHAPSDLLCDDGRFCNGVERCDANLGCLPGTAVPVNDGVPCTVDSCSEVLKSVVHQADDSRCDDGLFCNGVETCHSALGCLAGTPPVMDDGIDCTLDVCDEDLKRVIHTPAHSLCDDGNPCNGAEFCHSSLGCRPGALPVLDDGIDCTVDGCDPASGVYHLVDDAACDDGLFCNGVERCSPSLGCVSGAAPPLSDGVPCTLDLCNEVLNVVVHLPQDSACDDGKFCNGPETCHPLAGCLSGAAAVCDDGNPCSLDTCNPALNNGAGACDFTGRVQHCQASCGGQHEQDAGDDSCGYDDACFGGLAGGDAGVCVPLCVGADCVTARGSADRAIPDGGCVEESVAVEATHAFIQTVDLRLDVYHFNIGDLEARLIAPDASEVVLWNHGGNGRVGFHNTFHRSYPNPPQSLCSLQGRPASGTWTLRVCDTRPGQTGLLQSWNLYVTSTDDPPLAGNSCGDAVVIPGTPGTYSAKGETVCASSLYNGSCGGVASRERVYRIDLEQPAFLQAVLRSEGWDGVLYLKEANGGSCGEATAACADACEVDDCDEVVQRILPSAGTWYLFVDGTAGSAGFYELSVDISALAANGTVCTHSNACLSGHCSNGYCCASGTCCQGDSTCPGSFESESVCLSTPDCQGIRLVKECVNFSCTSHTVDDDSGCAGLMARDCGAFPDRFCSNQVDQAPPACATSCADDIHCKVGAHCDSTCVWDAPNGTGCDEHSDCVSGYCSNGLCCDEGDCCIVPGDCPSHYWENAACHMPGSCQGHWVQGICWNYTCARVHLNDDSKCDGTVLANGCGFYRDIYCTGQSDQPVPSCPTSCQEDHQCDANAYCQGICRPKEADGTACSRNSACTSGHCGNGFCCSAGDCCDVASSCPSSYSALASCGIPSLCQGHRVASTCLNRVCGSAVVEDDSGCTDETLADDCGLYTGRYCNGMTVQTAPVCASSCFHDGQCDAVAHCLGGVCMPDLPDGAICTANAQCMSSHCSGGFCCQTGDCCQVAADCPGTYSSPPACTVPQACQGSREDARCDGFVCGTSVMTDDSGCDGSILALPCGAFADLYCSGDTEQLPPVCATGCLSDADCDADAHCDTGVCQPKQPNGLVCDAPEDCLSGICVDNVCCDTVCDGTCEACGIEGSLGLCTPHAAQTDPEGDCGLCMVCDGTGSCGLAAAGQDPRNDCPTFAAETCQGDGTCDGSGACRKWVSGTVCFPAECLGAWLTEAGICDGTGGCQAGATLDCTPYVCDEASGSCRSFCDEPGHCAAGFTCNTENQCVVPADVGQPCMVDVQCLTGFCRDGYCCDGDCGGECMACDLAGQQGACRFLPGNSDPDGECGPCRVCNGTGSCRDVGEGLDPMGDCEQELRSTCGRDGACDGAGSCRRWSSGTVCVEQSCAAGEQFHAHLCDGMGTCVSGGTSLCHPYVCQANWGCHTSCVTSAHCTADAACVGGVCEAGRPQGSTCTVHAECQSGFCVDGYCCNVPCGGACQSCAVLPGVCSPFLPNTDPEGECGFCRACDGVGACTWATTGTDPGHSCAGTSQSTCGLDGSCDGTGACRMWQAGTVCQAQKCLGTQLHPADLCDGLGGCVDSGTQSCSPYWCNASGSACRDSCDLEADCAPGYYCEGNACLQKKAGGETCSGSAMCLTGHCVDGYCCNGPCASLCQSCSLVPGECRFIAPGEDPGGECSACRACDGAGGCTWVASGADPKDDCTDQGVSSCHQDGTCDGTGGCRFYPAGSVCQASSCWDATMDQAFVCDGAGTCLDQGPVSCNPYRCDQAGVACRVDCTDNAHCVASHYCQSGNCVPKKPVASPCVQGFECTSSFCADSVCCLAACDGECQSCNQASSVGQCSYVANNRDPVGECGLCRVCNGSGACKNATGGTDPKSECIEDEPETCGNLGVCDGTGQCAFWPEGMLCSGAKCTGHMMNSEAWCDGVGYCVPGSMEDCSPYVCLASGEACRALCTTNAHCVTTHYCDSQHECVVKKPQGWTCASEAECASGYCVDGYCCDRACSGSCRSCAMPSQLGTCTHYAGGTDPEWECPLCMVCSGNGDCAWVGAGDDPKEECPADPPETCLGAGHCDGTGSCAVWAEGTLCGAGSCVDATYDPPDQCDGWGSCVVVPPVSCLPQQCAPSGDGCLDGCTDDRDCSLASYCNENRCVPKKSLGKTCLEARECSSGFCVDGYCCDQGCDGSCRGCNTNPGICTYRPSGTDPADDCGLCGVCNGLGSCHAAAAGTDPKAQCQGTPASGCGQDGTCDGANGCRLWSAGTVCELQRCFDTTVYSADLCDGFGTCMDAGTVSCLPYRCAGDGSQCLTACGGDGDCASGHWCNPSSVCVVKGIGGAACTDTNQCMSGFCAEGVCCESACSGACRSCRVPGLVGVCQYFENNSDPKLECGLCRTCNGAGSCKFVSSGLDPLGQCIETPMAGCGADGTCDGTGGCRKWLPTTICVQQTCVDHVTYWADTCNGAGTCVDGGFADCSPYRCLSNGTDCRVNCSGDSHCMPDFYCDGTVCTLKKGRGSTCLEGRECRSGVCADGYCCDSQCEGPCRSCALSGFLGTCSPYESATDPEVDCGLCQACNGAGACAPQAAGADLKNECAATDPDDCGLDGQCDGAGQCRLWSTSTVCRAVRCVGMTMYLTDYCDGSGVCIDSGTQSCAPYRCLVGAEQCRDACVTDGHCSPGNYCLGNECVPKKPWGITCSEARECASGHCVDGYCCNTACDGLCASCSQNPGTCSPIVMGTDPAGECGTCQTCDGGYACSFVASGADPLDHCQATEEAGCGQDGTCDGTGTCRLWTGTVCREAYCLSGFFYPADVCDGSGLCADSGQVPCAPYKCAASGLLCSDSCVLVDDCVASHYCEANLCVPRQGLGELCGDSTQCASGFCADGVCCDSACDGVCRACHLTGWVGVCSYYASNTDPASECGTCQVCNGSGECRFELAGADLKNSCEADEPSSCGQDGSCDGAGGCRLWSAGVQCQPQSCVGQTKHLEDQCGGDGSCVDGGTVDCSPYLCRGDGLDCRASCSVTEHCADGSFCSGSSCVPRWSLGTACSQAEQCLSGFCADGYCCDADCSGVCRSCGLPGTLGHCVPYEAQSDPEVECGVCAVCDGTGTCGWATDGTDPKAQCIEEEPLTCGFDGQCNGAGDCRYWSSSTVCQTAFCSGTLLHPADLCSGAGVCQNTPSVSCCPYRCNAFSTACRTGCALDSDCCEGNYCRSGECVAKQAQGATCTASGQCESGYCVDGYCCNGACSDICQTCAAAPGVCTVQAEGTDVDDDCPLCHACSGVGPFCVVVSGGEDPAHDCSAEAVWTCGRDGACNGYGGCRLWEAGTTCQEQYCVGDTLESVRGCDGAGTCVGMGTILCEPYVCNAAGTDCRTMCAADSHCSVGHYCSATLCHPKKPEGVGCLEARECSSGYCADGVCCNQPCAGVCQSCGMGGSSGVCTAYAMDTDPEGDCGLCRVCNGTGSCKNSSAGTDPKEQCGAFGPGTCFQDGECDGSGGCRLWGAGTLCAVENCSGSTWRPEDYCDGTGNCLDSGIVSCSPYMCGDFQCRTTCFGDEHCFSTHYCHGSTCLAKGANGSTCTEGRECSSGFCVDGYCCNSDCSGACQACNLSGSAGICANVAMGFDPANDCGLCRVCNGAGVCVGAADGTDPKAQCEMTSATTCGLDGQCDGLGGCRLWRGGSPCGDPGCSGTTLTAERFCNGTGTCLPIPASCEMLGWNTSPASPQICAQSEPCSGAVTYAAAVTHCQAMGGRLCTWEELADNETLGSGCGYEAQRIWTLTQCSPLGHWTGPGDYGFIGSVPKQCRSDTATAYVRCCASREGCCPHRCSGDGCATTCSVHEDCCTGAYCSLGQCVFPKANGAPCSNGLECASGHCVDGFCCNSACVGPCEACNVVSGGLQGNCSPVPPGTDPDHECGLCMACNGSGACGVAPAGTDPHYECPDQSPASCGTTGVCSGFGTCELHPPGTGCLAAYCAAGWHYGESQCDGNSVCVTGPASSCSPYVCDGSGTACRTTCAGNSHCQSGFYCAGGSCLAYKTNGEACSGSGECSSGFCVDGVCCNTSCPGLCRSCNTVSAKGTCANSGNATDPDNECGLCGVCNGAGACKMAEEGTDPKDQCTASSVSTCGDDGVCNGKGACRKWPGGTVCQSETCSGTVYTAPRFCDGDGTCLSIWEGCGALGWSFIEGDPGICGNSSPCSGLVTFEQAQGLCFSRGGRLCTWSELINRETEGTGCGYDSQRVWSLSECAEDSYYTGPGDPDYLGSIPLGCTPRGTLAYARCCSTFTDCGPYACGDPGCRSSCSQDAHCASGYYCSGSSCVPRKANGATCSVANECVSGICVDGYCCNSQCDGLCRACNVTGSWGTCTSHPLNTDPEGNCGLCQVCNGSGACASTASGTDPLNNCPQDPMSTCRLDGQCNGLGACRLWASGTVCNSPVCLGEYLHTTDYCNGSGTCVDSGTTHCCPYACTNGGCRTSCSSGSHCCEGSWCLFGWCV